MRASWTPAYKIPAAARPLPRTYGAVRAAISRHLYSARRATSCDHSETYKGSPATTPGMVRAEKFGLRTRANCDTTKYGPLRLMAPERRAG